MNDCMILRTRVIETEICLPHRMHVNGICNKTQEQSYYNMLVV